MLLCYFSRRVGHPIAVSNVDLYPVDDAPSLQSLSKDYRKALCCLTDTDVDTDIDTDMDVDMDTDRCAVGGGRRAAGGARRGPGPGPDPMGLLGGSVGVISS